MACGLHYKVGGAFMEIALKQYKAGVRMEETRSDFLYNPPAYIRRRIITHTVIRTLQFTTTNSRIKKKARDRLDEESPFVVPGRDPDLFHSFVETSTAL